MNPALAVSLLVVFLLLGLRIHRYAHPHERRRAVNLLILYTVGLSAVVVATQRDAWPFTTYILAAFKPSPDRELCRYEFIGVGADEREWVLDPYTFSPQDVLMMELWVGRHYPSLDENAKQRALSFLLHTAEERRKRLSEGRGIGPDAWLGRFWSAGLWSRMERQLDVPRDPYQALRIYRVCWTPRKLQRGTGEREASLVSKYP